MSTSTPSFSLTKHAGSDDVVVALTTDQPANMDAIEDLLDGTTNDADLKPILQSGMEIADTSRDHGYILAVSELAANRTVTMPLLTASDTYVFADFAQTLKNKQHELPQIHDTSSDHQYIFAVSELSADRTVTLPLLDGNATFAFIDFSQTYSATLTVSGTLASSGGTLSGTWISSSLVIGAGSGIAATFSTSGIDTGIQVVSTTAGANGPRVEMFQDSASPANGDFIGRFAWVGNHSGLSAHLYGYLTCKIVVVTDGSEDSKLEFHTSLSGADNLAMHVDQDGKLFVDDTGGGSPAQVDLFDKFEDAPLARSFRLREPHAVELFEKHGLIERTPGHLASGGYMRNVVGMQNFILDAIHQVYTRHEDRFAELEARVA